MAMALHAAVTERVFQASPQVKGFRFRWQEASGAPRFRPGQWMDFYLVPDPSVRCAGYSFVSSPYELGTFEILVRRNPEHPVTRALHESLKPGDTVYLTAGQGDFHLPEPCVSPVLLLGGGIGVTPLISMVRTLSRPGAPGRAPFVLLHAVEQAEELLLAAEWGRLSSLDPRFRYVPCVKGSPKPLDAQVGAMAAFLKTRTEHGAPEAYLCGPGTFNEDMTRVLLAAGWAKDRVRSEKWW